MERPAKRPRLLTPLDSVYAGFGNQHAYYETPDDELNDYEELEEEEEDEPVYDPDQELQRKRARVDFKLKSTFEAIFEKYGRDFEGIGDEIDMRTGEVVVNNGHLLEMRHEMDAGDSGRSQIGERSWSEEEDDDMSGSEEDDDMEDENDDDDQEEGDDDDDDDMEEDEEDYDDEDALGDGDRMEEDDLILRGFAQASQQFKQRHPPHESGPSRDRFAVHAEPRHRVVSRPSLPGSVIPSRSEILAQFGPQLGPEIAKYVSKKGLEDKIIEPAWRVPDIVPMAPSPPNRRPLIKSMVRQPSPELERSPSPENAISIWAVNTSKLVRKRFSRYDDNLLLDFVADARRQGLNLSSHLTWRQLEATNPRHDWNAWKSRYTSKFTYLHPGRPDESDLSTSETSVNTDQIPGNHLGFRLSFTKSAPVPPRPSRPVEPQRPARVRKPTQRDGIVSWSEAVATIASVDPIGNAGLLDDVRRTTGLTFNNFDQSVSSYSSALPGRRHSQSEEISNRYPSGPRMRADSFSGAEVELPFNGPVFQNERSSTETAPCPHVDCRPYPNTLYRLERRHDEELSPMCSHLLRVHRIAPFPCGELKCEQKGPRGYFMQRDLVQHVREAHPYTAAQRRLRGRVEPTLLDQRRTFDRPRESIENHRPTTSYQQPRDSNFMSPQRPFSSHSPSSGRKLSLGFDQGPDRTLTPRPGVKAISGGASSMHIHPSSASVRDMSLIHSRQRSSGSDLQILDANPFLKTTTSQSEQARYPESTKEIAASEKPAPCLQEAAQNSLHNAREPKLPCTYPGCEKMISTHPGNMNKHLKVHERRLQSSTAPKESATLSKTPLPTTIPNSQSSGDGTQSSVAPAGSTLGSSKSATQNPKPDGTVLESFIDRSYEFSDEEEGIRPVIRRQAPQPALSATPLPVPHSFFARSPKVKSPRSVAPPMRPPHLLSKGPSPKVKTPRTAASPIRPSDLPAKDSSPRSNQPFTTPAIKARRRKYDLRDVLDSEEYDELSLDEHGFVLLSARPKPGALTESALAQRVKLEEADDQSGIVASSKKRRLSFLQDDNEIDELAEDDPSMATPGPIPTSKYRPKKAVEEPILPSMRPIMKFKSRKRLSNGVRPPKQGSSLRAELTPFQTPTKQPQLPAKTNTPLIDLVKGGQQRANESGGSNAEIPSTSELGSSPNSHRLRTRGQWEAAGTSSPLTALVTPHKTWAGRTVNQEDQEDSVVTPGGTLRMCGQDGFACRRTFCFRCSADRNVA